MKDLGSHSELKIKCYESLARELMKVSKIGLQLVCIGHIEEIELKKELKSHKQELKREFIINNFEIFDETELNETRLKAVEDKIKDFKKEKKKTLEIICCNPIKYLYPCYPEELYTLFMLQQILKGTTGQGTEDTVHLLVVGRGTIMKSEFIESFLKICPKSKETTFKTN